MYPGDDGMATPSASADVTKIASSGLRSMPTERATSAADEGRQAPGADSQTDPHGGTVAADRLAQHLDRVAEDLNESSTWPVGTGTISSSGVDPREQEGDGDRDDGEERSHGEPDEPGCARDGLQADRDEDGERDDVADPVEHDAAERAPS